MSPISEASKFFTTCRLRYYSNYPCTPPRAPRALSPGSVQTGSRCCGVTHRLDFRDDLASEIKVNPTDVEDVIRLTMNSEEQTDRRTTKRYRIQYSRMVPEAQCCSAGSSNDQLSQAANCERQIYQVAHGNLAIARDQKGTFCRYCKIRTMVIYIFIYILMRVYFYGCTQFFLFHNDNFKRYTIILQY